MSALVTLPNVEDIVGHHDEAIRLYAKAFDCIEQAHDAMTAAHKEARLAHSDASLGMDDCGADEIKAWRDAVRMPDRALFMRVASKVTAIKTWRHIIRRTELERLMDAKAKQQLEQQLRYVSDRVRGRQELTRADDFEGMPPLTVDNIMATLEGFRADADMIWRRGLANTFSGLDRRFRSHDGFKIGSRIILDRLCGDYGRINEFAPHGRQPQVDHLLDVERAFLVLDGKPVGASYGGILGQIKAERKAQGLYLEARRSDHEGDYFRVRIFQNGNAHLWFTRKDLVEKVNLTLAAYYGEVIGDTSQDREAAARDEAAINSRAITPARNFGFFPTPDAAADRILECILGLKGLETLEPSAGTGALARRLAERGAVVDVVEVQPGLASDLETAGLYRAVIPADFLQVEPRRQYDLVVMNPPFDRERDIDHVTHAWRFVKPGGQLVAIMSAGTEFRETPKARAFRKIVEKNAKKNWFRPSGFNDLPPGSFASVGTNVNTVYVDFRKQDART